MKNSDELVDSEWQNRAYSFKIRVTDIILRDFYSTEEFEANSLTSRLPVSKTQVCQSEDLVLIGVIQQFNKPGNIPALPDFTNTRLWMDVQHGSMVRGPDGLFAYGRIGLGAVDGKVMATNSFLRMSEDQFQNLIRKFPSYLHGLVANGLYCTLETMCLTYEPFPRMENGRPIWDFGCKRLKFSLTTLL